MNFILKANKQANNNNNKTSLLQGINVGTENIHFSFLFYFLLNLLGEHWLIGSCKFQVYIFMIHGLYIALCAHHWKSNHLLSAYIWPPYQSTTLHNFPPVTTVLLFIGISEFQFYVPHVTEIIWFLAFRDRLISLSIVFSRSIHVLQMAVFCLFFFISFIK